MKMYKIIQVVDHEKIEYQVRTSCGYLVSSYPSMEEAMGG